MSWQTDLLIAFGAGFVGTVFTVVVSNIAESFIKKMFRENERA